MYKCNNTCRALFSCMKRVRTISERCLTLASIDRKIYQFLISDRKIYKKKGNRRVAGMADIHLLFFDTSDHAYMHETTLEML